MLNQIVLVGKVVEVPEVKETSIGVKVANLLLEVDRNWKSTSGEFEKDLISCTCWRSVAEATQLTKVGDVVGVKGRLVANSFETSQEKPFYYCEVVAEKLSFLENPTL